MDGRTDIGKGMDGVERKERMNAEAREFEDVKFDSCVFSLVLVISIESRKRVLIVPCCLLITACYV